MSIPRRIAWISAVATLLYAAWPAGGSSRAQSRSEHVHHRHFDITGPRGRPRRALAMFPRRGDRHDHPDGARYPLIIALHGRGETFRGWKRGYLGWSVDYELPAAFGVLQRGHASREDYQGFVTEAHRRAVNAELEESPFGGALVVTPYLPDIGSRSQVNRYVDWLAGDFLAQVRERFTAASTRAGTGIDGVSYGGWIALEAGLRHPEVFASVGGIQPAITGRVRTLAERAAASREDGHEQAIRLLTSERDPYRGVTRKLSRRLREARVPHRLLELPGPHGYGFNRGPGAIELLRFHERALAREPLQ